MPRRTKPKSPAQIAADKAAKRALDFEAVGLAGSSASLAANEDVQVTREGQSREGQRTASNVARRTDAFDALRDGMAPGAYDAARRLERDMLIRRGEGDRGRVMGRVDCEAGLDRADLVIAAAERIEAVLSRIGERDRWLLTELILPSVERPNWRTAVAYVTGESHVHAQAAVVRSAASNLAAAYSNEMRKVA